MNSNLIGRPKTVKEFAETALKETRGDLFLGSFNAPSPAFYDKATDKHVIFSGLFPAKVSEKNRTIDALLDYDKKIKDIAKNRMRNYLRAAITSEDSADQNENQYRFYKNVIAPSLAGNCEWLTFYALIKLIDLGYTGKAEVAEFSKLGHVFLILNRPEESDPKDYRTWGKDCIILESWLNKIITADKFGEFWKDQEHVRFLFAKKGLPNKDQMKIQPANLLETFITWSDKDFRKFRIDDSKKEVRPKFLK